MKEDGAGATSDMAGILDRTGGEQYQGQSHGGCGWGREAHSCLLNLSLTSGEAWRQAAGTKLRWLWLKGGSHTGWPSRRAQKGAAASLPGSQTWVWSIPSPCKLGRL